jgi:hypothetical protein
MSLDTRLEPSQGDPMTTKAQVRSDFKYARELMRQADTAMKNDDIEELSIIAHELVGSANVLFQYTEERKSAI